ncbi:MAG: glutaminyl-peptide cyclotransferase [Thermoleophilia bacterium]|nr:glutaminyl-peptide cyclotransferase [Thermoleophilia bacterium]
MTRVIAAICAAVIGVIAASSMATAVAAPAIPWELVDVRPHDPRAFTQGLVAHRGELLESTGDCCPQGTGQSSIRRVDPATGRVLAIRYLPAPVWAEGVTVLRGVAWQLTWFDGVAYRVSPNSLRRVATLRYPREGWGITTQGGRLVASDGTARLRWLRARDLRVTRTVVVRDGGRPVDRLNELELIGGLIWANVWPGNRIALIRPRDGAVRGWLDLSGLRSRIAPGADVLNGIARDPVTGNVIVTGKNWNRMFVIRLPTTPGATG